MKNIKIFILLAIFLVCTSANVWAGTFKADAKTKRIPAGATFKLEFLQPISTFSATEGDEFSAIIKNDQKFDSTIVLPAGSVVRGSIGKLKTAKRLSRGAMLYLDFDHVVTPAGRQIPLDLAICSFDNIYYDGGLYKNLGYSEAVKENYEKAVDITKKATSYGFKVEDDAPILKYITVPICAAGGFIGGAGYLAGNSILDVFRKGQDVKIQAGDTVEVKLLNPIDIPVY
ncbi:MAG: hypothetical protein MJ237_04485 [bacterium]|nr:hypothetical protein [bacterium]